MNAGKNSCVMDNISATVAQMLWHVSKTDRRHSIPGAVEEVQTQIMKHHQLNTTLHVFQVGERTSLFWRPPATRAQPQVRVHEFFKPQLKQTLSN